MLTVIVFWQTKSMDIFLWIVIISMSLSILWVVLVAPESPEFLYSKQDFDGLYNCLKRIQTFNRNFNESKIRTIISKLQNQSEIDKHKKTQELDQTENKQKESLLHNSRLRTNLLACCYIWSSSSFSSYLISYFVKYLKSDFFVN